MAVQRRRKAKQDDVVIAKDEPWSNESLNDLLDNMRWAEKMADNACEQLQYQGLFDDECAELVRHLQEFGSKAYEINRFIRLRIEKSECIYTRMAAQKDAFYATKYKRISARTREELIERHRPCKNKGYQVLAMAVCGTPPVGREPHGVTNEWIWTVEEWPVEETTNTTPQQLKTCRWLVSSRISNRAPGSWIAGPQGGEGILLAYGPSPPPTEFFQLVPGGNKSWRKEVMAFARPVPSVVDMGETGIHVKGGAA